MAKQKSITVYQFSELTPSAQARAREWFIGGMGDWWDRVYADADTIANAMGWRIDEISFSGFASQGDGAHFIGHMGYAGNCVQSVRAHAPNDAILHSIAAYWLQLQAANLDSITATVRHSGRYMHAYCTSFEVERDGEPAEEALETAVVETGRRFMNWIYRQLENEYDALTTNGAISEACNANGYEFHSTGEFFSERG